MSHFPLKRGSRYERQFASSVTLPSASEIILSTLRVAGLFAPPPPVAAPPAAPPPAPAPPPARPPRAPRPAAWTRATLSTTAFGAWVITKAYRLSAVNGPAAPPPPPPPR